MMKLKNIMDFVETNNNDIPFNGNGFYDYKLIEGGLKV